MLTFFSLVAATLCVSASDSIVELTTFNAGVVAGVPLWRERMPFILSELPNSTADVLCLQELWLETDQLAVVNATSGTFPHHVRLETHPSATPPCDVIPLQAGLVCVQTRCPSNDSVDQILCALLEENCRSELRALGQRCMNCLVLGSPNTGLLNNPLSCAVDTGVSYSTTNGLLLLSKIPLNNTAADGYNIATGEIDIYARGYLSAEVENLGTVVCTHLPTPNADRLDAPYFGPVEFNSFEEEQKAYIQQLMNRYSTKSPLFLMGDFNHGPAIGDVVTAEFPQVYQNVLDQGFVSPAVTRVGLCTSCLDNSLKSTGSANVLLDHVYVQSQHESNVVDAKRLYEAVLPIGVPLSDHYGISVTYEIPVAEDPLEEWKAAFAAWKDAFREWQENKEEC